MQLIDQLSNGFSGATAGTATLFKLGTSTPAPYFNDFQGTSAVSAGTPIVLSSTGAAEVYVNELVQVTVVSDSGAPVAQFVPGDSSPNTEVRSLSFNGADYTTAAVAPGNPTTLQSALDLVKGSFGAEDWKVLFGGADVNLQTALAGLGGLFFNVKDPTYGAVGDGTTDDTAAIQAAIDAADDIGGVVYFPGTASSYRTVSALSLPANVNLLGVGSQGSQIILDNATANIIQTSVNPSNVYEAQSIIGLRLAFAQTNTGSAIQLSSTSPVLVDSCYLGGSLSNPGTRLFGSLAGGGAYTYRRCTFEVGGDFAIHQDGVACTTFFSDCKFLYPSTALNNSATTPNGEAHYANVLFELSSVTGGTHTIMDLQTGTMAHASVTGCRFRAASAPTVTGIDTPSLATTRFAESANTFVNADTAFSINFSNAGGPTSLFNSIGSREAAVSYLSTGVATDNVDGGAFGNIVIRLTGSPGANYVANVATAFSGAHLTLTFRNESTGTVSLAISDAGTALGVQNFTSVSVSVNATASIKLVYTHYSAGNATWVASGDSS